MRINESDKSMLEDLEKQINERSETKDQDDDWNRPRESRYPDRGRDEGFRGRGGDRSRSQVRGQFSNYGRLRLMKRKRS